MRTEWALLAAAVCRAPTVTADAGLSRRALVDAVNSDPGVRWRAGLGPSVSFADDEPGDKLKRRAWRGVLPHHEERIRRLAAEGTIRPVTVRYAEEDWPTARPSHRVPPQVVAALPRDFDAAEHWAECRSVINDIRDQGNCGCCWAFAAAEVASDRLCIAARGQVAVPLSAEELCFCSSHDGWGCQGGWSTEAFLYIQSVGLVTGQQQRFSHRLPGPDPDHFANGSFCSPYSLPHCHHHGPLRGDPFPAEDTLGCPEVPDGGSPRCPRRCTPGARPPHDVFELDKHSYRGTVEWLRDADAIAAAIVQCGPVAATMMVYDDFEQYVGGVYHLTRNATFSGGHAVKITGFGETEDGVKYWKVANSWNPFWGENGFFRVLRGVNEVGIESSVLAPGCDATWHAPGGRLFGALGARMLR